MNKYEKYKFENYDEICNIIYSMRKEGKKYKEICEELNKNGIHISIDKTTRMGMETYRELKEKDPLGKKKKEIVLTEDDKKILDLREKGYTFEQIAYELNSTKQNVNYRYRKLKNFPKNKYSKELKEYIFNLREEGLSYQIIERKINEMGYRISYGTIEMLCKEIYKEKNMKIPETIIYRNEEAKQIDEIIYNSRIQKMNYKEVLEALEKNGFSKSIGSIIGRSQRIFARKGEIDPNIKKRKKTNETTNQEELDIDDKELANEILNLIKSKNATLEQVKIIAKYYGVDLDQLMDNVENNKEDVEER